MAKKAKKKPAKAEQIAELLRNYPIRRRDCLHSGEDCEECRRELVKDIELILSPRA